MFDCPLKITEGAEVYPTPPVFRVTNTDPPDPSVAVAVAAVVLPEVEKVTAGATVKPLPPFNTVIAVTTPPPGIVVVAIGTGQDTVMEPVPEVAPTVFPVTLTLPEKMKIPSQGLSSPLV